MVFRVLDMRDVASMALVPPKAIIMRTHNAFFGWGLVDTRGKPLITLLLPTAIQSVTKLFSLVMKKVARPLVCIVTTGLVKSRAFPCVDLVPPSVM